MTLRPATVPLGDLECVTKTSIKVRKLVVTSTFSKSNKYIQLDIGDVLRNEPEAIRSAQQELLPICASWTSEAWDELDWARIKELSLRNVLDARKAEAARAQERECLRCPDFVRHVSPHGSLSAGIMIADFYSLLCGTTNG